MLIQKRSITQLTPWCHSVLNMVKDPDGRARGLLGPHAHQFEDVYTAITTAHEAVRRHAALRATAVKASEAALRNLARYCGDARMFVLRRMVREDAPPLVQERFNKVGERPKSQTSKFWIPLALDLLAAEKHAEELGHAMMAFPTAADVQEVLTVAEAARDKVKETDFDHRRASEALRAANDRLILLWQDTGAWFRYSLRRKSKSEQRAIMRRFEFEFADGVAVEAPTAGDPITGDPSGNETGGEPTAEEPTQGSPTTSQEPEPSSTQEPTMGSGSTQSGTDAGSQQSTTDSGSTQPGTSTDPQPTSDSGSTGPDAGSQPTGSSGDPGKPADSTQTPPIVATDGGGLGNDRG